MRCWHDLPPSLRGNFCNTKFVYDFVVFSFECHLMYQWQFSSNIWILWLRHDLMNKWQFSFNVCLLSFCPQTELACVDKNNIILYLYTYSVCHQSFNLYMFKIIYTSLKRFTLYVFGSSIVISVWKQVSFNQISLCIEMFSTVHTVPSLTPYDHMAEYRDVFTKTVGLYIILLTIVHFSFEHIVLYCMSFFD